MFSDDLLDFYASICIEDMSKIYNKKNIQPPDIITCCEIEASSTGHQGKMPADKLRDYGDEPLKTKIIFMCDGQHISLLLVFPRNRIIISLDPSWPGGDLYGPFEESISSSCYKFRKYHRTNIPLHPEGNYIRQPKSDKYSCGVYCARYFSQILTRYYEASGFKGFIKAD